jgi:hypothetical protein
MPLAYTPPPTVITTNWQPQPPALRFLGFQPGMPLAKAQAFIKASGGNISCQPTHTPNGLDCTGTFSSPGVNSPIAVQIASLRDSVTTIVLTTRTFDRIAPMWVSALREDYGPPKDTMLHGVQESWLWSRGKQALRIVERSGGKDELEAWLTLGSIPLPELPTTKGPARPD